MDAFVEELARRLAARPARAFQMPGVTLRESAVLVPLVERGGVPHLVFTRRPATLRTHAGQIAFPGGRRDPGDPSAEACALRELEEELGVPGAGVRLLGALHEVPTLMEYRIQPFVGVLPAAADYRPNPAEVALVFEAPLPALADPAVHTTERHGAHGHAWDVDFYRHGPHVIWGATGRILRDLLSVCAGLPGMS